MIAWASHHVNGLCFAGATIVLVIWWLVKPVTWKQLDDIQDEPLDLG